MRNTTKLRQLLEQNKVHMAPGCHDALGAYLIQRAGFSIAYMTGYGVACSLLARPDLGEITMSEQIEHAGRIADSIDIPLICDSDSGYGGMINIQRSVRQWQKAGVAGIHIEDQVEPKRCVAMDGMKVVDLETAVTRIKAAVAAKEDPDFVVIARTDAKPVHGLDHAIDRAKALSDAGADMVYVELMQSRDEVEKVAKELAGYPLFIDVFEHPSCVIMTADELQELGFKIISYPMTSTLAYAQTLDKLYSDMRAGGGRGAVVDQMMPLHDFEDIIQLKKVWTDIGQLSQG